MKVIGITGQSGVGKTTFAQKLVALGAVHIDADKIVHEMQKMGTSYYSEIVSSFGMGICTPEGEINRRKLGAIVFSDKKKLAILNTLTSKYVLKEIRHHCKMAEQQNAKAVLIDAIYLIESGFHYDILVAVVAEQLEQIRRIMARDGISEDAARARLRSQKPEGFYTENADFVVHSGDSAEGILDFALSAPPSPV